MSTVSPRQQLDAANAAQQAGRVDEAERLYRSLLGEPGVATAACFNLACMQLGQGRLAEAAEGLAAALAADPANPWRTWAVREMGLALYRAGYREVARPWLEEALVAAPDDGELQAAWRRSRPPAWLEPEIWDPGLERTLLRAAPREADRYVYTIDVVGTCNLRCPTCPVGNLPDSDRPTGFMPLATFRRVIDKIRAESPVDVPEIWLFNWGEPLLHPDLPAMIELLEARGLPSFLSTNLNVRKGLSEVIAANPGVIKVSMSGFSEATYPTTHVRGRLALLEHNLVRLRELIDEHGADTRVWVGQHVYRNNRDELEPVARLCRELGFEHRPIAAFYQPLEKLLALAEGEPLDEPVLDLLLEHPRDYLPRIAAARDGRFDCELRANQTVINHDGQVALCCSLYEVSSSHLRALPQGRPGLRAVAPGQQRFVSRFQVTGQAGGVGQFAGVETFAQLRPDGAAVCLVTCKLDGGGDVVLHAPGGQLVQSDRAQHAVALPRDRSQLREGDDGYGHAQRLERGHAAREGKRVERDVDAAVGSQQFLVAAGTAQAKPRRIDAGCAKASRQGVGDPGIGQGLPAQLQRGLRDGVQDIGPGVDDLGVQFGGVVEAAQAHGSRGFVLGHGRRMGQAPVTEVATRQGPDRLGEMRGMTLGELVFAHDHGVEARNA